MNAKRRYRRRRRHQRYYLALERSVVARLSKPLPLQGIMCPYCHGEGEIRDWDSSYLVDCHSCARTGFIPQSSPNYDSAIDYYYASPPLTTTVLSITTTGSKGPLEI